MRRPIWSRPENPTRDVARRLGVTREQLRDAIHRIKEDAKLGARDRITIWDDGTITDERGETIGNVHEEV